MGIELRHIGGVRRSLRVAPRNLPRHVGGPDYPDFVERLDREIAARARRARIFGADLFRDPAWDILLEVARVAHAGQRVCVSSIAVSAHLPDTTALRYLGLLAAQGYVHRQSDPGDKRRIFVMPTRKAIAAIARYLDERSDQNPPLAAVSR